MKRIICSLLILSIVFLSSSNTYTVSGKEYMKSDSLFLEEKTLSNFGTLKDKTEIDVLNFLHIDTSSIEKITKTENGTEYIMNYDGLKETILLKNNNENIILDVTSGEKHDVLTIKTNGELILDGCKVEFSKINFNESDSGIEPYGTIWKGTKSTSPYGSLKASDYNKFLTSGKQNLSLGKALDQITVTVLCSVLSTATGFVGAAFSLTSFATSIISALSSVNPKTKYLGCECTTYTCGPDNYKYISKYYANTNCTGTYKKITTYEHFIVY